VGEDLAGVPELLVSTRCDVVWQGGLMATESTHRTLTVERVAPGQFEAVNSRGGRITFGTGGGESFTPTELLLIAIGGCTAIDVDILTSRRAEPESFQINVDADKVRDEGGNRLTNIEVTYRLRFPAGEAGDAARAVLPDAVQRSHDRLCTVGRTVELPTPITTRID
jgi:putative redox protein